MAGAHVKEFTDSNFDNDVLKSSGLVVVDFWAEWCAPCVQLAPTIDAIAGKYDGKAKVGKVDIESNPKTAADFNIMAIPTILFFKDGQIVKRFQGYTSEAALSGAIEQATA